MKIIHVVPTLGAGGTEQNALRLAQSFFDTRGFENMVIAMRAGDRSFSRLFEDVSRGNVCVLPEGRRNRMRAFQDIVRSDKAAPIIFHFFNIDQALMALGSRRVGAKRILAAAGNAAPEQLVARRKWAISIFVDRLAECPIVSASAWIQTSLTELGRLPEGSCIVHNGVDIDRFRPKNQRPKELLPRKRPAIFAMIARLDSMKDHETLIRGFALFRLKGHQPGAKLKIIGDGPQRAHLEALTSKLRIADDVLFLGTRLDIPNQLHKLDAFVFSTRPAEGFGIVLVEAMAAGVPIVANSVPSSREVLRGGELGTLVSEQSPEAWASAFEEFFLTGPSVAPPQPERVEALYGLGRFYDGYRKALGLPSGILRDQSS